MSENSPVRHRIDGLEIAGLPLPNVLEVRHRIDGLESYRLALSVEAMVRHRIDGLEIVIRPKKHF